MTLLCCKCCCCCCYRRPKYPYCNFQQYRILTMVSIYLLLRPSCAPSFSPSWLIPLAPPVPRQHRCKIRSSSPGRSVIFMYAPSGICGARSLCYRVELAQCREILRQLWRNSEKTSKILRNWKNSTKKYKIMDKFQENVALKENSKEINFEENFSVILIIILKKF